MTINKPIDDMFGFADNKNKSTSNKTTNFEGWSLEKYASYTPTNGHRNEFLSSYVMTLTNHGKSTQEILDATSGIAEQCGYDVNHLSKIIDSASNKKLNEKSQVENERTDNDIANAKRLINLLPPTISVNKDFYIFVDGVWTKDTRNFVGQKALKVSDQIIKEIQNVNDTHQDFLLKFVRKSKSNSAIKSMQDILHNYISVDPEKDIDNEETDYLINMRNGTFDVKSGKLLPHNQHNLITMQVPYDYDSHAECPEFMKFLNEIAPDMIEDLQRLCGEFLYAGVFQHIIIFHGLGANGKTILVEVLRELMGTYATSVKKDVLASITGDKGGFGIHTMMNKRLTTCSETGKGDILNIEVIKELTGGNPITSSAKFKQPVTWNYKGKTIIETNHKPIINESTNAIWRRIKLFRFMKTIKTENQIPFKKLMSKLTTELSGIFNWAYEGYRKNQVTSFGQSLSPFIIDATKEYELQESPLAEFLLDVCDTSDPNAYTPTSVLLTHYDFWCAENPDYEQLNLTKFGRELTDSGFSKITKGGLVCRLGIKLNPESIHVKPREQKSENENRQLDSFN